MAAASSDPTDESLKMNVQKRMVFSVRSKMKGVSHRNRSHFTVDYTGKARLGWRMCVLLIDVIIILCSATRKLPKVVSEGSYEDVFELLEKGADPREADNKGRTPLHFAACRGSAPVGVFIIIIIIYFSAISSSTPHLSWC